MGGLSSCFIGVDSGGTTTRVLIAEANGTVVARGEGPGANLWSSGTSATSVISTTISTALDAVNPAIIEHGVIAAAGGTATDPESVAELKRSWNVLGLPGAPDIVPDVLASYAAGTTSADGVVLAAGTGAIAARVSDWTLDKRVGGHGWLVGDEGSAVWLGIEAVRSVVRSLDGRGPSTPLVEDIAAELDASGDDAADTSRRIVTAVYSQPPANFGLLAPLVIESCKAGDPIARSLVDAAVDHLCATTLAVVGETPPPVLVLAGSMVTKAEAVRSRVRKRLSEAWPNTMIVEATSGEAGAVAIAIRRHTDVTVTPELLSLLTETRGANRTL